eukprot:jgi/Botrbrau1/3260/Bobra.174_1s0031.1
MRHTDPVATIPPVASDVASSSGIGWSCTVGACSRERLFTRCTDAPLSTSHDCLDCWCLLPSSTLYDTTYGIPSEGGEGGPGGGCSSGNAPVPGNACCTLGGG